MLPRTGRKLDIEAKNGVVIGDAWIKIKSGQDRAVFWYKQALPGLTGLTKVRVEKRVQELAGPGTSWTLRKQRSWMGS